MADIETADRTARRPGAEAAGGNGADGDGAEGAGPGHGGGGDGVGGSGDGTATGGREARPGSRLAYNPALDGLRGVAVAAVLLFHGGYSWARGGYLGVSTFFTLSGFLITSLLVAERVDTGRIRLSAFWARRLRRLFPASALTLAGLSLSAVVLEEGWERELQGDVLGALFQVANWRFIFDERSYAELFTSPSPVVHFWSLAIEEQFYWAFPLLAAGVFALAKGSLRVFAAVLGALLAASAALTLVIGTDDTTFVYYATPIRMGEILVGCLLAVGLRKGLPGGRPVARLAAAGGVVALAASAFAWWNVGQDSPRLYQGGLLAYAVVSGVLVLSATVAGPVRTALSFEPLRLLGVISYGVYLYHWPVFLVLDNGRTGLAGERLFLLRALATLSISIASYFLLERPIRRGWRPHLPARLPLPSLPMPALAGGTFAVVVVVAVIVPRVSEPPADPFAAMTGFNDFSNDPDPASLPPGGLLGLTVGDSTMFRTAWGLGIHGLDTETFNIVGGSGGMGCGIVRGGETRYRGLVGPARPDCNAWEEALTEGIEVRRERYGHVDFAFVMFGPWDVSDHRLEGTDEWVAPGDPVYDEYLRSEIETMADLLLEEGIYVVWATSPYIDTAREVEPPPEQPFPESDPARTDRLNEIVRDVMDEREGAVVLDVQGYLRGLPGGEMGATYTSEDGDELPVRPDGVHFETESSIALARQGLGDEFLQALQEEPPPEGSDWQEHAAERALQPATG